MSEKNNTIVIHNIKNVGYRQIHVDGAQGGITPTGFVNVSFFSQRNSIPKGTEFNLSENGDIKEAIKDVKDSKIGIVREFEFGAYMDINTCISIKNFLESKIEEYNTVLNSLK